MQCPENHNPADYFMLILSGVDPKKMLEELDNPNAVKPEIESTTLAVDLN